MCPLTTIHAIAPGGGGADEARMDTSSSVVNEAVDGALVRDEIRVTITARIPSADRRDETRVLGFIARLEEHLAVTVRELDLDLVGPRDIASRLRLTPDAIGLAGDDPDLPASAPAPLGRADGVPVWDWYTINHWLLRARGIGDPDEPLPRPIAYQVNAALARRTPDPSAAPDS